MARIALISGSLRAESSNSAVVATIGKIIEGRAGGHEATVVPMRDFPPFDEDVERAGHPAPLEAARGQVAGADALIVCSPAYNGYPSGVLKNALDWLSRPGGGSPLTNLPTAVLSASPGQAGGANVQPHVRRILANCGAAAVECDEVAVGDAISLRTSEGLIEDPAVVSELEKLVDAVLAAVAAR
ncbi:NAD(P)H-dependent oxidoreductase [Streptomyces decoyicus]|uniref:NADPH-dependent FMN reductase n=1 Tax=Streptomyces decoyicus TaxID=249567 RepID=UPI002E2FE1E3|nr:NAD(P)H-dependent oxidoreductase [Streptomyces decoyicus]